MERNQRGFGDGAYQDKYDGGRHRTLHWSALERPGLLQERGFAVRSFGLAKDDEAQRAAALLLRPWMTKREGSSAPAAPEKMTRVERLALPALSASIII